MTLIDAWNDVLTPDVAAETHAHLESQLAQRGLVFGGRALCTVLRPRLTTPAEVAMLQRRIRPLLRAFGKAYDRAVRDSAFRAQFGLLDWEESLLASPLRYRHVSPTSRLDFFYVPHSGALGLTEYNGETPAGPGYNDALSESFLDTRAMREFSRHHEVFALPARHGVIGAILDAWREFSRSSRAPRIGILDWNDVPTRTEFELFRQQFAQLNIDAIIDDPRQCEYRGGKLYSGGKPIDVIYKRVLISELIETCGVEHDVVRAVRDGAVCMVNGFHSKILHKKASLAVLSDEANADTFDTDDLTAIHDCIPWTRVVAERSTSYRGRPVDLIPFMHEAKDRLVLKPNDEYGGKGIVLGWTVDSAAWDAAVKVALAAPHIVQEKVEIPKESYPSWADGTVVFADRMIDTAPFVTNGDYMEGILTRLSTAALLNVTAGGGSTVPTFVVQPRN
ncbi:MAG: hypothetical protein IT361_09655 [Gemmatimonadaceae bacterium]|nr:hypothetical protein [Gemmatimonadaceae bacterium]